MIHGVALCAGMGGIELGLRLALGGNYQCITYCERNRYAARVLEQRMRDGCLDPAPIWDNLATFPAGPLRGRVDLVSAGFPCQPFSTASRGRRAAWDISSAVCDVISALDAPFAFLENVSPAAMALPAEILRSRGYRIRLLRLGAAELGAPHQRPRSWLLAYHHDAQEPERAFDAQVAGLPQAARATWSEDPARLLGMDDGATGRVDRLQILGNGAVPAVAAVAFATLVNNTQCTAEAELLADACEER